MYNLEYERVVQILRQLRSTGEFHADILPCPPLREGGRTILFVQKGSVVSCFILDMNGQKLYHDNPTAFLAKIGMGFEAWG